MSSYYDKFVALADRLLKSRGRVDGVLKRPSGSDELNPSEPWKPTQVGDGSTPTVVTDLSVLVLDRKTAQELFQSRSSGNLSQSVLAAETEAMAILSTGPLGDEVPLGGDILETGSRAYAVSSVEELAPGDRVVLYFLELKSQ